MGTVLWLTCWRKRASRCRASAHLARQTRPGPAGVCGVPESTAGLAVLQIAGLWLALGVGEQEPGVLADLRHRRLMSRPAIIATLAPQGVAMTGQGFQRQLAGGKQIVVLLADLFD